MLKKIIIWLLRAASVIVIIYGILQILENPKNGIGLIVAGAIGIIVTSKIRTKVEKTEYKNKQKTNVCAYCGHSMHGAQYRYVWNRIQFDSFFVSDYEGDTSLPVTVTAICPKCGAEKEINFKIKSPGLIELSKPSFSKEAYAQRKIREYVENLFKD